jgi:hypothetical protein
MGYLRRRRRLARPPEREPFHRSMRPTQRLANSVFRLLYRHTHARAWRHNERLWPHVTIERDDHGDMRAMSYRGRPLPVVNGSLPRGMLDGDCHIVASGPSVADIDYGRLVLPHVMGVNGAIALAQRHPVAFESYCFNDTGFVRARPALVEQIVTRDLLLFTTPLCLWHVLQQFPADALRCRIFLVDNPLRRAFLPARDMAGLAREEPLLTVFDEALALGFSHDLRRGWFDVGTVAYNALQAAVWLGFRTVYLHGVDLAGAAGVPRFYERAADRLPTTLEDYLDGHILPSFRQARPLLDARGVRLLNLSPRSALGSDIVGQADWRALVQPVEGAPGPATMQGVMHG